MKIEGIQIRSFGKWQNLDLPISHHGLNVIYGPNEAGKSTLMRFIQQALFGYHLREQRPSRTFTKQYPNEGTLQIQSHGKPYQIFRSGPDGSVGLLSVSGLEPHESSEVFLKGLLGEIDESHFNSVFSIDLTELQKLGTLQGSELSEQIYNLTLGTEGATLLALSERIRAEQDSVAGDQSELNQLLVQYELINGKISSLGDLRPKYGELSQRRQSLEIEISELKNRQDRLQDQLRGHELLQKIWKPWQKIRQYQAELHSLPEVFDLPADALERLNSIDEDLDSATRCRETIIDESDELKSQLAGLRSDPLITQHALMVQFLVDQSAEMKALNQKIEELQEESIRLKSHFEDRVEKLGYDWTLGDLDSIDDSPQAHHQLVLASQQYQHVLSRTERLRQKYERQSQNFQIQEAQLQDEISSAGAVELHSEIEYSENQIQFLKELHGNQLERECLDTLFDHQKRAQEACSGCEQVPQWVKLSQRFFLGSGLVLGLIAIWSGFFHGVLLGSAYLLAGLTFSGISLGTKSFLTNAFRNTSADLQSNIDQTKSTLVCLEEDFTRLTDQIFGSSRHLPETTVRASQPPTSVLEEIERTIDRKTHLSEMLIQRSKLDEKRLALTECRKKIQESNRSTTEARQKWCATLNSVGMSESVDIQDALQVWQCVAQLCQEIKLQSSSEKTIQQDKIRLDSFFSQILEISSSIQGQHYPAEPFAIIDYWKTQLQNESSNLQKKSELTVGLEARNQESLEYQALIDDATTRRSALLVQCGATSREELEKRGSFLRQREAIEEKLAEANTELSELSASEPELAITEESLEVFDSELNTECVETLNQEIRDVSGDLQKSFESLGSIKQELRSLESNLQSTQLRYEKEQILSEIKCAVEQFLAVELAARGFRKVISKYEEENQPQTLAGASRYLQQLTSKKYPSVWTPLGEKVLFIRDGKGQDYCVEELSGGTREMLFLAIRLSVIDQYRSVGVELPIVLDDVLVNLDQSRMQAAVETLVQYASSDQQVLLFTCHQHIAQMFEDVGTVPIWLPDHQSILPKRQAG